MTDKTSFRPAPIISVALILTGVFLGLLLAVLAVWADYESTAYGFMKRAKTSFRGLACPVLMGRDESKLVTIKVSNSTDQTISPSIRSEISTPLVADEKLEFVKITPGEQVILQRNIGPENIDLGQFIFVYVNIYSAYPMPDQERTCGVFVLPVDGNGSLILGATTAVSILLMSVGLFFLSKNEMASRRSRSLMFMVAVTLLTMIFGFIGWWIQAIVMLVLLILTLVVSLSILLR